MLRLCTLELATTTRPSPHSTKDLPFALLRLWHHTCEYGNSYGSHEAIDLPDVQRSATTTLRRLFVSERKRKMRVSNLGEMEDRTDDTLGFTFGFPSSLRGDADEEAFPLRLISWNIQAALSLGSFEERASKRFHCSKSKTETDRKK